MLFFFVVSIYVLLNKFVYAVGVEADADMITLLLKELEGKHILKMIMYFGNQRSDYIWHSICDVHTS